MAWIAPMTFVAGTALTAAQLNMFLRDNLNETAPAKANFPGSHFVTVGPNQIAERRIASHYVEVAEETDSTSFEDLATLGPTVTIETGESAVVFMGCNSKNNTANVAAYMSVEISGASSISAEITYGIAVDGLPEGANYLRVANFFHFTNLTPGVNTFQAKYRVNTGTGRWSDRRLLVMGL